MTHLLQKLKFQREKKGMDVSDGNILYALQYLLASIKDKWLLENFSVANINSKFNEIISNAKMKVTANADIGMVLNDNSPDKYKKGW